MLVTLGSLARSPVGTPPGNDIDLLVDIDDTKGAIIMKLAGISESLRRLLGVRVDVVALSVLQEKIAAEAKRGSVGI